MSLETITGNLRDGYKQLQPGTMLHVDQLMNERRTNEELRRNSFYTADGEIYLLDGARKTPTLAMTREAHNPVLQNIDAAFEQLVNNHNYRVSQTDVQQTLAASDTILVALPNLRLNNKHDVEFSYLPLGTTPAKYNKLNDEERKLAQRVYGQEDDFAQNMKMLKDAGIGETRIWVLNPDYVRKHAAEGAIARASWLYNFDSNSQFYADDRGIDDHSRVRGVRGASVSEQGASEGRSAQKSCMNLLEVAFDPETASNLERMALAGGVSKQKAVRRAVRFTDYMMERVHEGYKIAFLKEGENPILVDFLDKEGNKIK